MIRQQFFSNENKKVDDEELFVKTLTSYAVVIKKSLNLDLAGELEFLAGYFQYCQKFTKEHQSEVKQENDNSKNYKI